jgi:hypothetical protein
MTRSSRRRFLMSFSLAVAVAGLVAGFASTSCATSRVPAGTLRAQRGAYAIEVLLDGVPAPTFERAGETYVLGQMGGRYTVRITNNSDRRIEAVVSVDGRDVIDGKPADFRDKRGYLVPAWGQAEIDGWRMSESEVAAFRFAAVGESYAARTGSARDVGVIGLAVFPERTYPRPRPLYAPPPSPWSAPSHRGDLRGELEDRDGASGGDEAPLTGGAAPVTAPRSLAEAPAAAPAPAQAAPPSWGKPGAIAPPPPAPRDPFAETPPSRGSRPGLGTEFGEAMTSPVREVSFLRADPSRPAVVLGARYNDRQGLVALGIDVDDCCGGDDVVWRQTAHPFPVVDRRYAPPPSGWNRGCCLR